MENKTIKLRPIALDDAEVFMELRNDEDTYHWFYSGKKFTLGEVRKWLKARDNNTDKVYIAEEDEQVVGTCSVYNISDEGHAEVGRIIVPPRCRGQGLGSRILEEVTQVAIDLGLQRLYSHIKEDNISSQRAFEKAGYQLTIERSLAVKHLK